jgi:hypothetical protein
VIEDLKGTKKVYDDLGGSGKAVHRWFCGACGRYVIAVSLYQRDIGGCGADDGIVRFVRSRKHPRGGLL